MVPLPEAQISAGGCCGAATAEDSVQGEGAARPRIPPRSRLLPQTRIILSSPVLRCTPSQLVYGFNGYS